MPNGIFLYLWNIVRHFRGATIYITTAEVWPSECSRYRYYQIFGRCSSNKLIIAKARKDTVSLDPNSADKQNYTLDCRKYAENTYFIGRSSLDLLQWIKLLLNNVQSEQLDSGIKSTFPAQIISQKMIVLYIYFEAHNCFEFVYFF